MSGRPYTTKEHLEIIQMWKDGKSAQEIADRFDRTPNAIRNLLSIHRREEEPTLRCEKNRHNAWSTEDCTRFADLWENGASFEEIAEAFGISVHTATWRCTLIRQEYGKDFMPYRRKFLNGR